MSYTFLNNDNIYFLVEIENYPVLSTFSFTKIHFELARLAAGLTVDTLGAPINDFRNFARFLQAWREQSKPGRTKMNAL